MITPIQNPTEYDIFEAHALIADYVEDGAQWTLGTDRRNQLVIFTTEITGKKELLNWAIGRNEKGEMDFENLN